MTPDWRRKRLKALVMNEAVSPALEGVSISASAARRLNAILKGAELDFVDDLMGQSFRVKNPNAVASCGCGVSFSV